MNERRRFTPEEKMKIVLEGLSGTIQVSELCRKYEITTTLFYMWKEKLLKNSPSIFSDSRGRKPATERKNEELQHENAMLKDTIAEITTENLQLKKKIGNYGVRR
ncbi:MAG: transposase [Thermoplasmatales archaeon]|jgi:transposase|nr:transposase [Candidatus Thermoplasmatota archaeon]MDA8054502.1 transposase [Thermoplasmatales archaeon]